MIDFSFAFNAILPMLLLIVVGYGLKLMGILTKDLTRGLNRLVFVLLIPVFMFYSIYNMTEFQVDGNILLYVTIMVFVMALIGYGVATLFIKKRQDKPIIIQSAIRTNASSIGLPIVLAMVLIGPRAEANVIAMTGLSIFLYNTLGVIAFQMYDEDEHPIKFFSLSLKVLRNPIIIGILLGFVAILIRPLYGTMILKDNFNIVYQVVETIAKLASPLALLALGGTFEFKAVSYMIKEIGIGVLLRSVVSPVVIFGIALGFKDSLGFDANHFPALLAVIAPSFAVTVPPMAQHMKSNHELASQLVVWTTITSTLVMFVLIGILHSFGLL
jgi:predicted permease